MSSVEQAIHHKYLKVALHSELIIMTKEKRELCNLPEETAEIFQDIFCRSILSRDPLLRSVLEYSAITYKRLDQLSDVKLELEILPKRIMCHICYESFSASDCWLGCGQHGYQKSTDGYCNHCMEAYLISQIIDSRMTKEGTISCPCRFCDKFLDKDDIISLVDEQVFQKFIHFINSKIVDNNPLNRWCPRPNCNSVVQLLSLSSSRAYCQKCHLSFCAKCSGVHRLVFSCTLSADVSFHKWKATTNQGCKRCPGCKLFIEKNEGCNHMKCARCFHEFCWICCSDWKGKCSSVRSYCNACKILDDPMWGKSLTSRVISKTVAVPVSIALGGAVIGIGIGAASIAAGAACVGAVTVGSMAVVVAPIHYGYKFCKRLRLTNKGLKLNPSIITSSQDTTALVTLSKGIRVICSWDTDDTKYINELTIGNNESFLGLTGRLQHGVFIAYCNFLNINDNIRSAVLYFVPRNVEYELLMELMPNPMIEVLFPYVTMPEPRRQPITFKHFKIALNSKISHAIESKIPVYPSEYFTPPLTTTTTRRFANIINTDEYYWDEYEREHFYDPSYRQAIMRDRQISSNLRLENVRDFDRLEFNDNEEEEKKSNDSYYDNYISNLHHNNDLTLDYSMKNLWDYHFSSNQSDFSANSHIGENDQHIDIDMDSELVYSKVAGDFRLQRTDDDNDDASIVKKCNHTSYIYDNEMDEDEDEYIDEVEEEDEYGRGK